MFLKRTFLEVVNIEQVPQHNDTFFALKEKGNGQVRSVTEASFSSFAEKPKKGDELVMLSRAGKTQGYRKPTILDRVLGS